MPAVVNSSSQYWRTYLHGFKPCHYPVSTDKFQNGLQDTTFTLKLDITSQVIAEFCSQNHITFASIFQTAWAIVIGYYAGVEDVAFGYSSNHEKSDRDADKLVICRTQITADCVWLETVAEMLQHFDSDAVQLESSISEIQQLLGIDEPMFNSGLHIQHNGDSLWTKDPIDFNQYDILALILVHQDGSLELSIAAPTSKISAFTLANVAHTLAKTLTESLAADVQTTIGELDMFSHRDQEQLLEWSKALPHPVNACFTELFETAVHQAPAAPAICSWDRNLTYGELDEISDKIGYKLAGLGAGPEKLVLVCFDKSSTAIASMLGIFKSGAAFAALDPSYAASRIQAIVEATSAWIVLVDPIYSHIFEGVVEHIVPLDHETVDRLPLTRDQDVAVRPPSPSNTAYVVFTSGSTGAPKGIMVEHAALCTAVRSLAEPMRAGPTTRFLHFAAHTFDLSYGDIFVTLANGGCLCLPSEHERVNDLAGAMVRMNVNTACLIPSVARVFRPEDVPCLRFLFLGGEALLQESLQVWGASQVHVVQFYGPSEATVWCVARTELTAESVANNIGWGLAARLWVASVASHERLAPIGCIGELLIEGPVLARGYLDARQTGASFVENPPWASVEAGQRRRFYKTGDLVRYDPDGSLCFMGRKDTQIKFHGRRIEMGEIEHHLASHPLLRQVIITMPTAGPYAQHLTAVVVPKTSQPVEQHVSELKEDTHGLDVERLRDDLSSKVPAYMVPQFWVVVEDIPLMISGKMNRVLAKRFVEGLIKEKEHQRKEEDSAERINGRQDSTREARSAVEVQLLDICSRVLDREKEDIGLHSDFHHLGGDSFSAMEIVAHCKAGGLTLTVEDILSSSTIQQMALLATISNGQQQQAVNDSGEPLAHGALKFVPVWWDTRPAPVTSY